MNTNQPPSLSSVILLDLQQVTQRIGQANPVAPEIMWHARTYTALNGLLGVALFLESVNHPFEAADFTNVNRLDVLIHLLQEKYGVGASITCATMTQALLNLPGYRAKQIGLQELATQHLYGCVIMGATELSAAAKSLEEVH